MIKKITSPFEYPSNFNRLGLFLWLFISLILIFNSLSHDPLMNYDSSAHTKNIKAYVEKRFPTPDDSYEYHSPPLPYVSSALIYSFLAPNESQLQNLSASSQFGQWLKIRFFSSFEELSIGLALKFSQLLIALMGIISIFFVAKIAKLIHPENLDFQTFTLLIVGAMPVFYRSFALVRGEPYLLLFAVLLLHATLPIATRKENPSIKQLLWLGILCGLAALSRQQGLVYGLAFAIAFLLLTLFGKMLWKQLIRSVFIVGIIALSISALFYVQFYIQNGNSLRFQSDAYSEYAETFSLSNQPLKFYISLSLDELFTNPIRPAYLNQFIPILFSDTYGDYHSHFLVYARDKENNAIVFPSRVQNYYIDAFYFENSLFPPAWLETNRLTIAPYLGALNLASGIHFFFLAGGLLFALGHLISLFTKKEKPSYYRIFILFFVLLNFGVFLYAAIMINTFEGEVIKATYLVQIFPLMALLAADLIIMISSRWKKMAQPIRLLLYGYFLFALPAFFTHYISWLQ